MYYEYQIAEHEQSNAAVAELADAVKRGVRDFSAYGAIRCVEHETLPLVLLSYSNAAMVSGTWTWHERVSRGLIIDHDGVIVARPFDKFFNWMEGGRKTSAPIVEVYDKVDGSLGIIYWYAGRWRIATRGSFSNEQIKRAEAMLPDGFDPDRELTVLVEIVYPENRNVVDYGTMAGLVLLGARWRNTGVCFSPRHPMLTGRGLSPPVEFTHRTVDEVQGLVNQRPHLEGVVVRFADGQIFKFKSAAYREAHRAIATLSQRTVAAALIDGVCDDLDGALVGPKRAEFEAIRAEIAAWSAWMTARVRWASLMTDGRSRKDAALWLKDHAPDVRSAVFMDRDGKPWLPHAIAKRYGVPWTPARRAIASQEERSK